MAKKIHLSTFLNDRIFDDTRGNVADPWRDRRQQRKADSALI